MNRPVADVRFDDETPLTDETLASRGSTARMSVEHAS